MRGGLGGARAAGGGAGELRELEAADEHVPQHRRRRHHHQGLRPGHHRRQMRHHLHGGGAGAEPQGLPELRGIRSGAGPGRHPVHQCQVEVVRRRLLGHHAVPVFLQERDVPRVAVRGKDGATSPTEGTRNAIEQIDLRQNAKLRACRG